jgi:putative transposase
VKKSRFNEAQIIGVLGEQEAGSPTAEVCRRYGISEQTFYRWKAKYSGMSVSDAQTLKTLEDKNRRLKKLLAESMPDVSALKDLLGKTDRVCSAPEGCASPDGGARLLAEARLRAGPGRSEDGAPHPPAGRCGRARTAAQPGGGTALLRLPAARHPAPARGSEHEQEEAVPAQQGGGPGGVPPARPQARDRHTRAHGPAGVAEPALEAGLRLRHLRRGAAGSGASASATTSPARPWRWSSTPRSAATAWSASSTPSLPPGAGQ